MTTSRSHDSEAVLVGHKSLDGNSVTWQHRGSIASTVATHSSFRIPDDVKQFRVHRLDSIDALMLDYPLSSQKADEDLTAHDNLNHNQLRAAQASTSSQGSCFCSPLDPVHSHVSVPTGHSKEIGTENPSPPNAKSGMQRIQWQYTKSAALFTISILITWIPPSINRARALTHPGIAPSFTLLAMSATVLPLQGFWNAFIFVVGSWGIIRNGLRRWQRERKI